MNESASLCQSLPVSASLCQSLPVSASLCQSLPVWIAVDFNAKPYRRGLEVKTSLAAEQVDKSNLWGSSQTPEKSGPRVPDRGSSVTKTALRQLNAIDTFGPSSTVLGRIVSKHHWPGFPSSKWFVGELGRISSINLQCFCASLQTTHQILATHGHAAYSLYTHSMC